MPTCVVRMTLNSRLSKHFPPLPKTAPAAEPILRMPLLNVPALKREQSGNGKRLKPRHLTVAAVSAVDCPCVC